MVKSKNGLTAAEKQAATDAGNAARIKRGPIKFLEVRVETDNTFTIDGGVSEITGLKTLGEVKLEIGAWFEEDGNAHDIRLFDEECYGIFPNETRFEQA